MSTINDPGNAVLAITVGSTHRDMPHRYGVSYFSSKGPTGDGRLKPDLLAPGERITSCAAGRRLRELGRLFDMDAAADDTVACYVDDSGTSMAAPHVSGAIAAFLSVRREFIGRPEEVKGIFLDSATSLGRERYFEGHGLVDLLRAIQRVSEGTGMYRSISTVKADAARRSYDALGEGITWAVLDSGIDARHPHFRTYETLGGDVAGLHRDFTKGGEPQRRSALSDPLGHGSYGAGMIAGGLPADLPADRLRVFEGVYDPASPETATLEETSVEPALLSGLAPRCKLVSLKVVGEHFNGRTMNVVQALEYVRRELIGGGRFLRVHGVQLGLGFEWDKRAFASGDTPLCRAVDELVHAGVVVVTTAGNTGYGYLTTLARQTDTGLFLTINDPGNSQLAITVGSTHRDQPHRYGVSYFSSKGPTLDGRLKPDLVAPGENIVSCATGTYRQRIVQQHKDKKIPGTHVLYGPDSGTAGAAAHVSGVIAAFLSVHREFIGRPEEVKRIFLESATSLGRRPEFQGHGLVDLMRAMQSV